MKIEVTKKAEENEVLKFPLLMQSKNSDMIIIMTNRFDDVSGGGVVISDGISWKVGMSSDTWIIDAFKPFTGQITLSND